jgi:hypothetical protein
VIVVRGKRYRGGLMLVDDAEAWRPDRVTFGCV